MRIGLYVRAEPATPIGAIVERIEAADAAGFATAWIGQLLGFDALALLGLAARTTRRIELGTWVLPLQPRHPVVLAQQALTVQAASGGRLLLGIGVSHPEVIEKRFGLSCAAPVRRAREHLVCLRGLLAGERVVHRGEELRLDVRLDVPPGAAPALFLAALGPRMLELAGEASDGAALWLCGPRTLERFAIPRIAAGARAAGRALPRIACGLPIALAEDAAPARAAARELLARSARLDAYRRSLAREGVADPASLALIGDAHALDARLDALAALGVSDFHAATFPIPDDPGAEERTRSYLAQRARGRTAG